jgi:hypothetical protein
MAKRTRIHKRVVVEFIDDEDCFLFVDGLKIAQRGRPGTPQADTWVSLEPGWKAWFEDDFWTLAIEYSGVRVH